MKLLLNVNRKQYVRLLETVVVVSPVLYALFPALAEPFFFLAVTALAWLGRPFTGEAPEIRFRRVIHFAYFTALGVMLLQIIPLPVFLLRWISNGTYQTLSMMLKPLPAFHTLSVAPGETLILLMELAVLGIFFHTAIRVNWEKEELVSLFNAVVASAGILMAAGLPGLAPDEYGIRGRYLPFYLASVFPLSLGLLFMEVRYLESSRGLLEKYFSMVLGERKIIIYSALTAVLGLGVLFTRSRIAWAACGLATLFLLFWTYYYKRAQGVRKHIRILFNIILAVALLAAADKTVEDLTDGGETRDESVRWGQTLAVFRAFPLTGAGFGTWEYAVDLQDAVYQARWPAHADIGYLELLAEGGLAGGAAMLVLLALPAWSAAATWRRRRHPQVKILSISLTAFFVACLFQFLFNTALRTPPLMFLFVLLSAAAFRVAFYKKDAANASGETAV